MRDGWYRVIPKEGTSYQIVGVEDGRVISGVDGQHSEGHVSQYLERGYTFTEVYPIHLPEDMWEEVHNEALCATLTDDDIVETAVRNFFIYFRSAPGLLQSTVRELSVKIFYFSENKKEKSEL